MIREGDELPMLERRIDLVDMVAYSAATWDWHPMHYDLKRAQELGVEAPIVDGQMFGAILANQLTDWLGADAFITNLSLRYKSMVLAGATVVCEGRVTMADGEVVEVSQTVRAGDRIAVEATARVRL